MSCLLERGRGWTQNKAMRWVIFKDGWKERGGGSEKETDYREVDEAAAESEMKGEKFGGVRGGLRSFRGRRLLRK